MIKSLVIRKQTSQIYFLIVKHLDRTFFVRQFLSMIKVTFFQRPQNCFTFLWKYSSEISMTKRYLNLSIMHSHHNGSRSIWLKKTWPLVLNNFINSRAIFSPTPVFLFFVPLFFFSFNKSNVVLQGPFLFVPAFLLHKDIHTLPSRFRPVNYKWRKKISPSNS